MLKELYVYVYLPQDGWVPAGLLEYEEAGRFSSSTFRYGTGYLARPRRIAVDPVQLPLEDRTFATEDGFSIFNGIRDAGPDKWGRYLLDKKFGRELSELEYVAAVGPDHVGAWAFSDNPDSGPRVYTPQGFIAPETRRLDLAQCSGAVHDIDNAEETERLKQYLQYGSSLGGARPKGTVTWNGKPYLAKFSLSRDSRNEPRVEFATMALARKCGLVVPDLDVTEAAGRSVYLIERFDRRADGTPIPFISGLTFTGMHESDYASWSYFALVDAIVKFSSTIESDLRELFKRMIFNILVYNNDDHLRNFGFIGKEPNRWSISPLYDVVPATVTSESYFLAMKVGADGKRASISNALSMCERFRLTRDEAESLIAPMLAAVTNWREHFEACQVSPAEIRMLENSFRHKL